MIKAWRDFWDNFLNNEAYFIARVRSAVGGLAMCGGLFAHETAAELGMPGIERPMKIAAVVGMALAYLMRAGEKNAKPDVQP